MNARSALFDLFGDHLRERGGAAPVAALVRLLAPLGVAPPAVRTAISRMVRQGWLTPTRVHGASGYALTPRATRRLDDAAARIYRTRSMDWDGSWHLLSVTLPAGRSARDRLRAGLSFLGYGPLDDTTWLAPRPAGELDGLLAAEGARAERFTAHHDGDSAMLIARAWDLDGLGRSYLRFLDEAATWAGDAETDQAAFVARTRLVHEWRKFLFTDPALPPALLPIDWPGSKAAAYFDAESSRLLPAAARFVDSCLEARE
ncbi:MAG TPA: PaaX family transcriptional regulator C-terminal domain-containing protein [Mycobacteriales bacterium]|nr:PaaX family transcriptional regulator C-terminal domain-containing protein [Mycobacteriales bacterium]